MTAYLYVSMIKTHSPSSRLASDYSSFVFINTTTFQCYLVIMPAVRNNQSVHGSSPYSASSSATITPSTKDKINTKPRSVLTEAQKAHLVAAAMEAAQKHMDFDQLSQTVSGYPTSSPCLSLRGVYPPDPHADGYRCSWASPERNSGSSLCRTEATSDDRSSSFTSEPMDLDYGHWGYGGELAARWVDPLQYASLI